MGKQSRDKTEQARAERAAKIAAMQAAERKAARKGKILVGAGIAIVLALLVAVIAVAVTSSQAGKSDPTATSSGPVTDPKNLASSGALLVGRADAPKTVTVFFDFMCPACGQFEKVNSADLNTLTASGKVNLELRPMTFLNDQSQGTRYSTRAANALATVHDTNPALTQKFYNGLFAAQPQEGSTGLTDEKIGQIATEAGVPADVVATFGQGKFNAWTEKSNKAAFDAGVTGTPAIYVNGVKAEDVFTPGTLTKLVNEAQARNGN